MKLLKTCNKKNRSLFKGFTLIEIIMVVAFLSAFQALHFSDFKFIKRYMLDAQKKTLEDHLFLARSRAMSNHNGQAHGLHFTQDGYFLFEGEHFDVTSKRNEWYPYSDKVIVKASGDVIFKQLSGRASALNIELSLDGINKAILVDDEGSISY